MKQAVKDSMKDARDFLKKEKVSPAVVSAPQLVKISSQLQKSFDQTLDLIAFLRTRGAGGSPYPYMNKLLTGKYQ